MEKLKSIAYVALVISSICISLASIIKSASERKQYKNTNPFRQKSLQFLRKMKLPINPSLSYIVDANSEIRSKVEILKRALAISVCVKYSLDYVSPNLTQEQKNQSKLDALKRIVQYDLKNTLSPNEKLLFKNPSNQLLIDTSWQLEALPHFAYVLGLAEFPPYPDKANDWMPVVDMFLSLKNIEDGLQKTNLIEKTQILNTLDYSFAFSGHVMNIELKIRKLSLLILKL